MFCSLVMIIIRRLPETRQGEPVKACGQRTPESGAASAAYALRTPRKITEGRHGTAQRGRGRGRTTRHDRQRQRPATTQPQTLEKDELQSAAPVLREGKGPQSKTNMEIWKAF